jgi:hypothetical protein
MRKNSQPNNTQRKTPETVKHDKTEFKKTYFYLALDSYFNNNIVEYYLIIITI